MPVLHYSGILLPAVREGERFTFTMCNPPFFASMEEAGLNPATAFSGTAQEMTHPGGELAFVMQMIRDSSQLQARAFLHPPDKAQCCFTLFYPFYGSLNPIQRFLFLECLIAYVDRWDLMGTSIFN